jgi:putative Mg2+ transporter-C (MgtC) family protein
MDDLAVDVLLSVRLLVAAALGAVIGLERELASHPAGMRTHLLVALGSSLFAVVSAFGYQDVFAANPAAMDSPQRIAAQIVSGIGFLGAGAIIHSGRWVRGLTTAASLWATAGVGLAVGAGEMILGIVGTGLIVVSLGPLHRLVGRWRGDRSRLMRLRIELSSLDGLARVTAIAVRGGAEVVGLDSRKLGKGRYEVEMGLRLRSAGVMDDIVASLSVLDGAELLETSDGRTE